MSAGAPLHGQKRLLVIFFQSDLRVELLLRIQAKLFWKKIVIRSHYYSLADSTNCTDIIDFRWVFLP